MDHYIVKGGNPLTGEVEIAGAKNAALGILAAAVIGLIPQSGPHMVFILLVAQGTLPFYVLLTSAISQQGHVSLPLLAQSKKSWVLSKVFCALLGIAAGMFCYMIF